MNPILTLLVPVFALLIMAPIVHAHEEDREGPPPNDATDTYEVIKIHGWTIRISARLKPHEELKKLVIDEVTAQLRQITLLLKGDTLKEFRKTEIWIEHEFPHRTQYHNEKQWLIDNGYNPDKTGTIEIAKAKGFLEWQDRVANTLLHELAHAYHDKVLGWDEPRIIAAYEAAKKSGKYEKILRDKGYMIRHYALDNHKEYFAEAVEAYFWCNDYYPFVYGELKEFDPACFKLMEDIFGKRFEESQPKPVVDKEKQEKKD